MEPLYALPILSFLLMIAVLRRDRRRQIIQNRLKTIKSGGEDVEVIVPRLSKLKQAASRSISVTMLLPQQLRVRLDRAFDAAGNRIGVVHLLIAALITSFIVSAFTSRVLTLNPKYVLFLTIAVACVAPIVVLRYVQAGYRSRFLNIFPDALDLIGRGVRAGLPVNEALVVAGEEMPDPVGMELRRALEQVQLGVPMIDALEKTADRIRIADFQFMVVALALQAKTGGSLAETLANLSSVIRGRKNLRLKIRGLTAEAKVSALVLAALPFIVGFLLYVINRDLAMPLIMDPRGRFMVGVALLSLFSGLTMMYVMIKRAVR